MALSNKFACMEALGQLTECDAEMTAAVESKGGPSLRGRLLLRRARVARASGELLQALEFQEQAEQLFLSTGDVLGHCASLNGAGITLFWLRRFEQATSKFRLAETISEGIGSVSTLQEAIGNQALVALEIGEVEIALRLTLCAEEICRDAGLWSHLRHHLQNLERICTGLGDHEGARAAERRRLEVPEH
jgi:tetratricopeptide (TPR) repeat protein